ncbi:MAG TPA: hypothetical protein VGZ22_25895 [Isosphaeraceae bacterium]|jgi:hypothetical protein|nr:hypothetical protein [Isosphaeraceae bacterium]
MHRILATLAVAAFVASGSLLGTVAAQTPAPALVADQVEEDWQLVVGTPDPVATGPQITTSMCPTNDLTSSPFVAFDLNYREYPAFTPGGMQVQVWSNKVLLDTSSQGNDQFTTVNETLTWTQRMSLAAGSINYAVVNGQSTTFGTFGQDNGLDLVSFPSAVSSLTAYSPDFSVANSGATWESDHVTSVKLVQVRYYAAGKLIQTDTTVRVVKLSN